MTWLGSCVAVVVYLGSLGAWSEAHGQAGSDEPPNYKQLIDQGLREYDERKFEQARATFREAHGLNPNARTFRVLGMVEFELEHYVDSWQYLTTALSSSVQPLAGKLRTDTEDLARRARQYVDIVHFQLQPAAAQVLVDGALVPLGPNRKLVLQRGEHRLEVVADTYRSIERKLVVKGGEEQTLPISLSRDVFPAQPPVETEPRETTALYESPWFWVVVGAGVAGGSIALAFALSPDARTEYADPVTTPNTPVGVLGEALGARW